MAKKKPTQFLPYQQMDQVIDLTVNTLFKSKVSNFIGGHDVIIINRALLKRILKLNSDRAMGIACDYIKQGLED